MPTELVLLSDIAPTDVMIMQATADAHPDGTFIDYRDGQVRQIVAEDGQAVIQVYPSRPVLDARQARTAVADPPASFALWTDLTIQYGNETLGRVAAQALAAVVGGTIHDRV